MCGDKNNEKKEKRRRSSIHDITLEKNGDVSVPQGSITCQTSYSAGKSAIQISPPPSAEMLAKMLSAGRYAAALTGEIFARIYGTPWMKQPLKGPFVSPFGNP